MSLHGPAASPSAGEVSAYHYSALHRLLLLLRLNWRRAKFLPDTENGRNISRLRGIALACPLNSDPALALTVRKLVISFDPQNHASSWKSAQRTFDPPTLRTFVTVKFGDNLLTICFLT